MGLPAYPVSPRISIALTLIVLVGLSAASAERDFKARAAAVIAWTAEDYEPTDWSDRGKYSFPKAIARFERHGLQDVAANNYIREYGEGKYTFFHFPFVGIARLMALYPEAPAISEHRASFLRRILHPGEGNHYGALYGEGTENHITMSRTSGYLFAEMAEDIPELRERAREWKALLRDWVFQWSKRALRVGTGEWDSSVYTFYNLVGWLNLYDFAEDGDVRKAARAVLDHYAVAMALKITDGVYGGGESRGGTKYGGDHWTATEALGHLWYGPFPGRDIGADMPSGNFIHSVHAATSDYRPPVAAVDLARKRDLITATYHNTKPSYLMTRAAESFEVFHRAPSFTLGSVATPYGGWTNASYGIVNWKLVMRNPDKGPAVVWGNSAMKSEKHARGRNPFDQFLQAGPVLAQLTYVPADADAVAAGMRAKVEEWKAAFRRDFDARWGKGQNHSTIEDTARGDLARATRSILHFPSAVETATKSNLTFLRYGDTFVAIRSLANPLPESGGEGRLVDEGEREQLTGFILEVAGTDRFSSFAAFKAVVLDKTRMWREKRRPLAVHYRDLDGRKLEFRFRPEGAFVVLDFDWGYGVREKRVFMKTADWKQPDWPSGEGHGRMGEIFIDGIPRVHCAAEPVYAGPGLLQRAGRLMLESGGNRYTLDFRGEEPEFTEGKIDLAKP